MSPEKFTIRFLMCVSALAAIIIVVFTCFMGASWAIAAFFAAAIAGVNVLAYRNLVFPRQESLQRPEESCLTSKSCLIALVFSVLLAFMGLAIFLYSSWLNGDDFVILGLSSLPLKERIVIAGGSYLHWVSRVGELVANIGGISFNRWQIWVLTPLLLISLPFITWKLVRRPSAPGICSPDGILFFWFIVLLLLTPTSKGWWQTMSVYVVGMNYLWPSVATMLLMALLIRQKETQAPTTRFLPGLKCSTMFALGMFCGWGAECTSVFLIPFSFAWLLYHSAKKIKMPWPTFPALMGIITGTMMLFLSTAHSFRSIKAESFRSIRPEDMPYEQIIDFVQHLTPEKVALLGGDNVILTGIPIYLHIYFWPYAAKLFLPIALPFTAALVLMLCFLARHPKFKIIFTLSCAAVATSWLVASSYLAQCIPTAMSFTPPAFFILAACGLAFAYLKNWQKTAILVCTIIYLGFTTFPAAYETLVYKQYEHASYTAVFNQVAEGKKDVVLPCTYAEPPKDKLGIIDSRPISESNASNVYNRSLAKWLNVYSILREKHAE